VEADVRAGVVEGLVQVARVRGEGGEIEAQDDRGLRRQMRDERRHLLVHDEVGQVLAAVVARVQVVEEELVLRAVTDREGRREGNELADRVGEVVGAERPGETRVHEVARVRPWRREVDRACPGATRDVERRRAGWRRDRHGRRGRRRRRGGGGSGGQRVGLADADVRRVHHGGDEAAVPAMKKKAGVSVRERQGVGSKL